MRTRVLAAIIIALCAISVIIGIINSTMLSGQLSREGAARNHGVGKSLFSLNKIALITLNGEITSGASDGFMSDLYSAESVEKGLRDALEDSSVKGVLLRINSPGGTVAMSQEIYSSILEIRAKKPVVVSMSDLAASGGYYISSAADRIFAEPGTLTGSVGVIMGTFNAQQLLNQKLGVKSEIIKSGKFKDIASPYRPMTADEKSLLQNIINSTYEQFVDAIIAGRVNRNDNYKISKSVLTEATLRKYADGRILNGEQAQKLGFVDQLGGIYEAQYAVGKMAKAKFNLSSDKLPLVNYNRAQGFGELLFGTAESVFGKKGIDSQMMPLSMKYRHQPLFVWE